MPVTKVWEGVSLNGCESLRGPVSSNLPVQRRAGTCGCRRVSRRLRRSMHGAHCSHRQLSPPPSGEILAECPPFICSPRQSSSPNDPHFSIFYTPEMGTAPIPLFLFLFHFILPFCVLRLASQPQMLELCRHFRLPQEAGSPSLDEEP